MVMRQQSGVIYTEIVPLAEAAEVFIFPVFTDFI
jgi:hypothetical protein